MSVPPPYDPASIPPAPGTPPRGSLPATLATLLSLYVGLFLVSSVCSLLSDTLFLFFRIHLLTFVMAPLDFTVAVSSIGLYVAMGLTPRIPKRLFIPLACFLPLALAVTVPLLIHFHGSFAWIICAADLVQVGVGLAVVHQLQGGLRLRRPLVRPDHLKDRRFSWGHLLGFLAVNLFVLLPVALLYTVFCASMAVGHFSDGFVRLRPHGITVQARTYRRDDGKTVRLFPMAHVADLGFYRTLSDAFTDKSIVLLEGVTDDHGLLTNSISYKRMARAIGAAEQGEAFNPRGILVPADVDISVFHTNTIGLLNLVMLVHAKGPRPDIVLQLLQSTPEPGFEKQLFDDLLHRRNLHVIAELRERLESAEEFVLPWGAAHMPGIAGEIEKLGFRAVETRDFTVLRFRRRAPSVNASGE